MKMENDMWKYGFVFLFVAATVYGCKGSDGGSGDTNVTLTSNTAFKASSFAIGCLVVSDNVTKCVCYESDVEYTGDATGSANCVDAASGGGTLVADGTKISDVAEGGHYYCSSTDPNDLSTLCEDGDANTETATLEAGDGGETGSTGVPGEDGADGDDKDYTITFTTAGRSIAED